MKVITKKSEIKEELERCFHALEESEKLFIEVFHDKILNAKAKFSLLEYCANEIYHSTPRSKHISICDEVHKKETMGGHVVTGKLLQLRLDDHFHESFSKAAEYVSNSKVWYSSDLIGERVFGEALLANTNKTLEQFSSFAESDSWVIRSFGTGCHYAGKKGLEKANSKSVFEFLLSRANERDKNVKAGIGWGAKTIARMHPDLIQEFEDELNDTDKVKTWFRTKVQYGLTICRNGKGD